MLQAARRDRALEGALAELGLVILDDLAHAQKDRAEASVLFDLIARRHETRSLAVAANRPFSAGNRVLPAPAVTAAAIDRLVHRATIPEMNADSHRRRTAANRQRAEAVAAPTPPADTLEGAPWAEPISTAAAREPAKGCRHRP